MKDSMFNDFINAANIVKELVGCTKTFFLHNKGNWGDGIIRHGTLQFFNHFEIKFSEIKSIDYIRENKSLYSNASLIYQGGGAFCRLWDHSNLIYELASIFKKVVILPSTYEIKLEASNIYTFSRDIYESKEIMPDSFFCHDLAFFITRNNVNEGKGVGFFFRTDFESKNEIIIPINNFDISKKGNHFSEPNEFFFEIDKYEVIYTDRLHVAIVACILNKIVHFFPGSYFKNKSVYYSSMEKYYPKAFFHESVKISEIDESETDDIILKQGKIILEKEKYLNSLNEIICENENKIEDLETNLKKLIENNCNNKNNEEYKKKIKDMERMIQNLSDEINKYKNSLSYRILHPIHMKLKKIYLFWS